MVAVAEEGAVAAGDGGGEGGGRAPRLHDDVRAEGEVEVEEELLPDEGGEVVGAGEGVGGGNEGLEEGEEGVG